MPHYRITGGYFRDTDDTIKGPGDSIEMGEDVALQHPGKLRLIDAPATADAAVQAANLIAPQDA